MGGLSRDIVVLVSYHRFIVCVSALLIAISFSSSIYYILLQERLNILAERHWDGTRACRVEWVLNTSEL